MQQSPYMHGAPHPQNPSVYVQQMPAQMSLHPSAQQSPYSIQTSELGQQPMQQMSQQVNMMGQMQQGGSGVGIMPTQIQPDQQQQQQHMMRFVRPSMLQQQPTPGMASANVGHAQQQDSSVAMETGGDPAVQQHHHQQQQQPQQHFAQQPNVDSSAGQMTKGQQQAMIVQQQEQQQQQQQQQSQENLLFKNLDQLSPLILCSLGKDVTREIVNQVVEFFKVCKVLQLPYQQSLQGQSSIMVSGNLEKQKQIFSFRQTQLSNLFDRLLEISAKVDEHFAALIPASASVQNLIPYTDTENTILKELKEEKTNSAEYNRLKVEHQETKNLLEEKQKELKEIMDFLTTVCWDTSSVLNHMNS